MFKLAKYYLLMQLYEKGRRNLIAIIVSAVLLAITSFIFGDLIAMANEKTSLVISKWIVLLVLLGVMTFNFIQIFKMIRIPFQKEKSSKILDVQKEKIVLKEHLVSQTELILNKYRDNK